ncbi:50S ribosomal protein L11 methyltransferase [Thermosulfurimonas sp. F29]|uniref:50S ribosomal protein L11 methyltransferase n=1 Tax=Thermosulfurimonas sp. F29 TaxID=2867247 RepID=UPI001C828E28|nr:50S ribosomal protein L11 methyltransferase [Thermosulfurimonas sp. F29]MBX6422478.1 50S ribosomal protein L11 methyltransferase [Thermosulfurimonas sp. F29]
MLRPPYERYEILYLYAFSGTHPDLRNFSDPDFIGCWVEEDLTVLFFHREKSGLPEMIERRFGLIFELSARVPYREWGEGRDLSPFSVGPFIFAPVWKKIPGALIYDPGVVFGSGSHPTTRLMLETLWEVWSQEGPFHRIYDLGCGSGLLTLFAARLGARVTAVDRNPLCVELTRHNLKLNGLAAEVIEGDLRKLLPFQGGLVLANLYKGLLAELLGLPSFLKADYYILSGFNTSMEVELREIIAGGRLKIIDRREREGWVCLSLKKKK